MFNNNFGYLCAICKLQVHSLFYNRGFPNKMPFVVPSTLMGDRERERDCCPSYQCNISSQCHACSSAPEGEVQSVPGLEMPFCF